MPKFIYADCPFCSASYRAETEQDYGKLRKCKACGGALSVGEVYQQDTSIARISLTHVHLLPNLGGESFEKNGYVVENGVLVAAPKSLSELQIPKGVLAIAQGVFENCRLLKKIYIPDGVLYIGKAAFRGCDGAKTLRLPKTLLTMGNEAFRGCRRLTEVEIPESLRAAGYAVFQECDNLLRADFPMDMVFLYGSPYRYCKNLQRATIPHCVVDMGEWFTDVVNLETLVVGRGAREVPLEFCGKLKAVYFARTDNWLKCYDGEPVPESELADPKKAARFLFRLQKEKLKMYTPNTEYAWLDMFFCVE